MPQETSPTQETTPTQEVTLTPLVRWSSCAVALIAGLIGVLAVMDWRGLSGQHEKALYWFGFALLVIVLPYVREIAVKGFKVVLDFKEARQSLAKATTSLSEATTALDEAVVATKELRQGLTASRIELIKGYQQLLSLLPEDQRQEKIIQLSEIYLRELDIDVPIIKEWLSQLGIEIAVNDVVDADYIDKLKGFQRANGLIDDGIFGYQTYRRINDLLKKREP
jgi:hypothetical protein